ncbi:Sm ribonucleoprotein-like protein [Mycena venus]|uniref:Small nuclear ribonucleoprotein G n=2 Tax=Mycenaceae TaxID=2024004 RepID=A0A8H6Y2N7_9AGAR|nr:Sm ribonucleoprotein-like protein [Mycena venus]
MSKASQPELKKFMDKKLFVHLQGGRKVSGTLRGYDLFLNLVIDDAVEETTPAQKHPIGTVVIRGNSVTSMETLESVREDIFLVRHVHSSFFISCIIWREVW